MKQFLERPASLKYAQIKKILLEFGFEHVVAKGSHEKFKHPMLDYDLVFPIHQNDCKEYYKKWAAKEVLKNNLHNYVNNG